MAPPLLRPRSTTTKTTSARGRTARGDTRALPGERPRRPRTDATRATGDERTLLLRELGEHAIDEAHGELALALVCLHDPRTDALNEASSWATAARACGLHIGNLFNVDERGRSLVHAAPGDAVLFAELLARVCAHFDDAHARIPPAQVPT